MDITDHVNFKIVNSIYFIGLAIQQPRLLCNLGSWFLGSRTILRFLQISEDFRHTTAFASVVHSYHGSGRTFFTNAILDECRTIVPAGYFDKHIVGLQSHQNIWIKTLIQQNWWRLTGLKSLHGHLHRLNSYRFSIHSWNHYSDDIDVGKSSSFTLYTVEVMASNVFLNKRYNLIHGKFLRNLLQANNENMFCYKTPSCIHKVNYDQLVNELWETDLTKYDKTVGNTTFGML